MMNYKFLIVALGITISPPSFAQDYQVWEKKYTAYKSLFSDNKKLEENRLILRKQFSEHIQSKVNNFKKSDVDKSDFYTAIIEEFDLTISSTKIFGQSLIIAYESDMRPNLKQFHFGEICFSLNIVSKSSTIKDSKSNLFIEWGSKHLMPSELNLLKESVKLNNRITSSVSKVCGQIVADESFWTK